MSNEPSIQPSSKPSSNTHDEPFSTQNTTLPPSWSHELLPVQPAEIATHIVSPTLSLSQSSVPTLLLAEPKKISSPSISNIPATFTPAIISDLSTRAPTTAIDSGALNSLITLLPTTISDLPISNVPIASIPNVTTDPTATNTPTTMKHANTSFPMNILLNP
ncbi:hypothetical protein ACHAW6_003570 [Cyclotella cf. meneghiniana]